MRQSDKETKRPAGLCSEPHRQAVTAEGPPSAEWTRPGVPALIPGLQATPTPAGPVHRDCQVPALCRVSLQVEGTQRRAPRSGWPCLRRQENLDVRELWKRRGAAAAPPPGCSHHLPRLKPPGSQSDTGTGLSSTPRPTPTSPEKQVAGQLGSGQTALETEGRPPFLPPRDTWGQRRRRGAAAGPEPEGQPGASGDANGLGVGTTAPQ